MEGLSEVLKELEDYNNIPADLIRVSISIISPITRQGAKLQILKSPIQRAAVRDRLVNND
jgi:hypothetical protein